MAKIAITGLNGVNIFTETFTMTFEHPRRLLSTCDATIVTPEPWLTIGSTQSVGASNNSLKSAVHEGD
jgi:hypothetical protein